MSKLILFGGGDGGGIQITQHGIKPIPPFDPFLRLQLRALKDLTRAEQLRQRNTRVSSLNKIIGQLTGVVLAEIEGLVGAIDGQDGLIFQDDDGGFTCGSTGKPPIPFPFPIDPRLTVSDLLSRGIVNEETLTFLEKAAQHKLDVFAVAANPEAAAKQIGIELDAGAAKTLRELKLDALVKDKVILEVKDFYQKVVADGRYITDWAVDPSQVAQKLKLEVSQSALERIITTRDSGILVGQGGGTVMSPAAVAVAVAIVIVLWSREVDLPVLDKSGVMKL